MAVDGPPTGGPLSAADLADSLAVALKARGRAALRVGWRWFLRPASLRLESGRTDADAFYDAWLDTAALRREVLDPAAAGADVLPRLWDPDRDRATRDSPVALAADGVLLVDGPLLLGRGLPFDLGVHVRLSPAARARRVAAEWAWTLPAFARYDDEVRPQHAAEIVVFADHPRRPAVSVAATES